LEELVWRYEEIFHRVSEYITEKLQVPRGNTMRQLRNTVSNPAPSPFYNRSGKAHVEKKICTFFLKTNRTLTGIIKKYGMVYLM
jgi:hypothetical protein